jgi:hypothetical protein
MPASKDAGIFISTAENILIARGNTHTEKT